MALDVERSEVPHTLDEPAPKTLGVLLSNRALNGSVGPEKTLKLPHNGVYFNSAATVGYWQSSIGQALFG